MGGLDTFIEHATTQDELRKKYGLLMENTVPEVQAHFCEGGQANGADHSDCVSNTISSLLLHSRESFFATTAPSW